MTDFKVFIGTNRACAKELERRGFRYSHDDVLTKREYWKRTDGKPDIFMDHSATITKVGKQWAISDFLNRNGVK